MSTHKQFDKICVAVIVLAMILTVLFMNGERFGLQLIVDADTESHSDSQYFTENDQDGAWDSTDATIITLTGDSAGISGNGAYVNDGSVYIADSGTYVIRGTLDDGSVVVDAYKSSKVWILLDGVNVTSSDNAAIRVDQADKVFLTLAEGSENTLTGGAELSAEALADGVYGAIFTHDDLTINGDGALTITANYKHGIKANDDLVITGGNITITAGDDGIQTENEASYIYLESGTINVTSEEDAVHSGGDILLAGGDLTIDAGDDGIHADGNITINDGNILINKCYEGIEAVNIDVTGGDIVIYPSDDGINANGGNGGFGNFGGGPGFDREGGNTEHQRPGTDSTSPKGGDSGADSTSPEGSDPGTDSTYPEGDDSGAAAPPEGFDGTIPDRDMENAAPLSADSEAFSPEDSCIRISGGSITIINPTGSDADGLDSNGNIYINGGDIRISLSGNGGNNAIDYGSESGGICEINGGTVIACGSSSMTEAVSSESTQCSILYNMTSVVTDNSVLEVKDADGNVLLTWEVPCGFSSANISCPEMTLSESYTIATGDTEETITLTENATTYGDVQSGMNGGMHGGMNGGMEGIGGMKGGRRGEQTDSGSDNDGNSESSSMQSAAPPDFSGENHPLHDGEQEASKADTQERETNETDMKEQEASETDTEKREANETDIDEPVEAEVVYTADTYIKMALCILVLGAGIAFVKLYRKY